ncbi:hypothetical protein BLOT_007177, partial [Blomia tropicalis]
MATSNERPVNFNLDLTQNRSKINESNELDTLTFIDFNPYIRRSYVKSLFTKQETYGELVDRVNQWLLEHPQWEAKTIESIRFEPENNFNKSIVSRTNTNIKTDQQKGKKYFAIRMWLCPRQDQQQPIQRLKVLNIIPKIKITGCDHQQFIEKKQQMKNSFSSLNVPSFETIEEVVPHLNKLLKSNPYFGQILNIETISMPVPTDRWSVDIDVLEQPPPNEYGYKGVLNILRIHFNERLFMNETVEILDFVPKMETWNAPMAVPNLESFTSVLKRASYTLRNRSDNFRFLSCNTICCPTNNLSPNEDCSNFIDPKRTFYSNSEWFDSQSFNGKYIRIAIAVDNQQNNKREEDSNNNLVLNPVLNCKIFVPVRKSPIELFDPEEMEFIKKEIQIWFRKTHAKILSIETEIISSSITWTSSTTLIDSCLNLNKNQSDILVVFKVYIDGHFIEPSRQNK